MHVIEDSRQQTGKHNIKHAWFEEHGVDLIRCKLPFGDYAPPPAISIDTKKDMEEIAGNICGKREEHERFIRECKAARDAGCKLIFLIENETGITDLSQVHTWVNPRVIFSPNCVQGARLQKAMETIQERYGVQFLFCAPEESAQRITEIFTAEGYE
jgi:ribosome-associated protein